MLQQKKKEVITNILDLLEIKENKEEIEMMIESLGIDYFLDNAETLNLSNSTKEKIIDARTILHCMKAPEGVLQ